MIYRRLGSNSFLVQVEKSPGLLRMSCSSMRLKDREEFDLLCSKKLGGFTRLANNSMSRGCGLDLKGAKEAEKNELPMEINLKLGMFCLSSATYIGCHLVYPRVPRVLQTPDPEEACMVECEEGVDG